MPWTLDHPPAAMRHLPVAERAKGVEVANALLREGHEEGQAIRIAIAQARRWVGRHGADVDAGGGALRAFTGGTGR